MLDWERAAEAFAWDGSLLDLYVLGTDEGDWETLLGFLRAGPWAVEFADGGTLAALPERAADIFARGSEDPCVLLRVDRGGLQLNCHFFTPSEIEFDLDPRDVDGPARLARLLAFMGDLAGLLCKPVLVTPENCPDRPLLRVGPEPGRVDYVLD